MVDNIFSELKNGYEFLSRVEKNIADLILSNPEEFITLSMTRLSELSGVSQGSINNFSKKFSKGGFSALKLKIAENLSSNNKKISTDNADNLKECMKIRMEESISAFRNTLDINSEKTLKAAVDKILAAKKIEIYGIYQSGISAKDFCIQLIERGIPASYVDDTLMCAVSASMLDEKSLVIAISSTGKTREIIDAVNIAKNNGTPIICITADRFSPLAKISDICLLSASSGISESGSYNEIQLSKQLLINTLCSYIGKKTETDKKNNFDKISDILNLHSIKD